MQVLIHVFYNHRILYADLEFIPEERFSLPARMLLSGMIKRDPSARLGAWENPPQDIMSSPFFQGIQWDAIYERRFDGPYIPDVLQFGSSRSAKSKSAKNSVDHTGGAEGGNRNSNSNSNSGHKDRDREEGGQHAGKEGEEDEEDSELDEEDEDSGDEMKGMRDSVFIQPRDGAGNNLLDWSFIDERVLAYTCGEDEDTTDASAKKKKKKKGGKRGSSATTDSAAAVESAPLPVPDASVKISEAIENKICFVNPAELPAESELGLVTSEGSPTPALENS